MVREIPLFIPQISHAPTEDRMREAHITFIEVFQGQKRDDTLRGTVNVDRVRAIMKVPGRTVFPEKLIPIKSESATDVRFELRSLGVLVDRSQSAEIVSRVKIVDPPLSRKLAIVP